MEKAATFYQNMTNFMKHVFTAVRVILRRHIGIFVLLFFTLLVSFFYYSGIYGSDDIYTYVPDLFHFMAREPLTIAFRFPVILVEYLSYTIFGSTIDSIPILFTFIYPANVFLSYVLTFSLSENKKVASLAALLVASSGGLFVFSGSILPDNLSAFWVLLGYISFVYALKSRNQSLKTALLILFSLFAVLSFITKEPAITTFIGCLPLLLILEQGNKKNLIKDVVIIASSLVLIYLLYLTAINLAGLSPQSASGFANSEPRIEGFNTWNQERGIDSLIPHTLYVFSTIQAETYEYYLMLGTAIVLVVSAISKKFLPLTFSVSTLVYLLFFGMMSVSLKQFVGFPIQFRYFAPIFVLMPVSIALFVNEYLYKFPKSFAPLFVVAAVIFMVQVVNNSDMAGNVYNASGVRLFKQITNRAQQIAPGNTTFYYSDRKYDRFSDYFKLKNNAVKFVYIEDLEEDFVFDDRGFYLDEGNHLGTLLGKASEFAQDNNLIFITDIVYAENNRFPDMQQVIPWPIPIQGDYGRYLLFGYFIEQDTNYKGVDLLNPGFEEWYETGIPVEWLTRLSDEFPATRSDIAYKGAHSLELQTSTANLNYLYQRLTITDAEKFDYLDLSLFSKALLDENHLILKLMATKDGSVVREWREDYLLTTGDWGQYQVILPLTELGSDIDIVIFIGIDQEGPVLVDELDLKLK